MKPTTGRSHEFALLGLLALLWGSSYLFIKIAVADIPPVTLIAARVTIAGLFLFVILRWQHRSIPKDRPTWRMLLIQSFLSGFGAWTILAWGQQHIDSGLASVLNSTTPIFVFLFTVLITRHEATSGLKLFGACLGLMGVTLTVGADALSQLGEQVAGQLAAIAGAILYACAAIYGKRLSHLPAVVTAWGTMVIAAFILIPFSLIIDQPWTLRPSITALSASAALSVLCTGLALLIYFRLLKTLGSLGTASQAYLRAGIGVLLGIVILGEQLTAVMAVGLLAAIIGVAAINMPVRSRS